MNLPSIPAEPIAKKKELLFSDDFERGELGKDKGWSIVMPTYSLENGTLKGTQMRFDAPAKDGKPAVKGHQAVLGNDIPTKEGVIEFRVKLGGAQSVTAEFDDRKFNGSHYGTSAWRASPRSKSPSWTRMPSPSPDPKAPPANHPRPVVARTSSFHSTSIPRPGTPSCSKPSATPCVPPSTAKPVAFLQSSGIARPARSKVGFGCKGKGGSFEDLKIWNVNPAK